MGAWTPSPRGTGWSWPRLRSPTAGAGRTAPGAAAFRAFAAATLPVREATAGDPDLPADLLPADWPGDHLASVLGQAMRAFYPLIND